LEGSDPDGDSLTFAVTSDPAHGVLGGTPPNLLYTPSANFNGADSFTFLANDGQLDSAPSTVSITIQPVNDPPVADAQSLQTPEDTSLNVFLSGSDVEGGSLVFTILDQPAHGTLTGTPPNLTYLPATNYHGADSFQFVANDGTTNSAPATVSLTVTAVNDPPTVAGQSFNLSEDGSVQLVLAASDADNDPLSFVIASQPAHGALSGSPPDLVYLPDPDFSGQDSFTFAVSDGQTNSAVATVTLVVEAVNDAPVVSAGSDQDLFLPTPRPTLAPALGASPGRQAKDTKSTNFWIAFRATPGRAALHPNSRSGSAPTPTRPARSSSRNSISPPTSRSPPARARPSIFPTRPSCSRAASSRTGGSTSRRPRTYPS